jgi:diguanylate cyclase (GGDEF)-like protein/PAS domain S-box-containing protein
LVLNNHKQPEFEGFPIMTASTSETDTSSTLLRTVLDAVSDHVAVLDLQGVIVMVNAAWLRYEADFQDLPGHITAHTDVGTNYFLTLSGINDELLEGIRSVLSGQSDTFRQSYACHIPNHQRCFHMHITPSVWAGQRCAVVVHSDITPQNMVNASPVMIWLSDTDGLCTWFNAGWLVFTGRTMAQETGNGWTEGVHPDDVQRCMEHYMSHLEQRLPFQMEFRIRHHSGQYRWIHDHGMPRFDTDGVFLGYIGSCVDVHEVRIDQNSLTDMADVMPCVVYQCVAATDGQWQFTYLSKGVENLYGVSQDAVYLDHNVMTLCVVEEDRAKYRTSVNQSISYVAQWEREYRIQSPTGGIKWVRSHAIPQTQSDGSVVWSGILTDVSYQKEIEQRLRQGANVFAHVQEAILITDAQRRTVDVNAAFTRITGYSRAEILGKNPRFLKSDVQSDAFYQAMWQSIATHGSWMGEVVNRTKSGEFYSVILNISAVKNESYQVTHYVGMATNIHHLKTQQQSLERVAHYDTLTQLPNRVLLTDRLNQAIAKAQRHHTRVAVCYLDLDGFKQVNDTLGHDAGDQVLKTVAERMGSVLRACDTAARIGGDEFVILLSDLDAIDSIRPLLERLLQTIGCAFDINGQSTQVGASIGVSLYPHNATEPDTLLRLADRALYQAKESGKNCYRICSR